MHPPGCGAVTQAEVSGGGPGLHTRARYWFSRPEQSGPRSRAGGLCGTGVSPAKPRGAGPCRAGGPEEAGGQHWLWGLAGRRPRGRSAAFLSSEVPPAAAVSPVRGPGSTRQGQASAGTGLLPAPGAGPRRATGPGSMCPPGHGWGSLHTHPARWGRWERHTVEGPPEALLPWSACSLPCGGGHEAAVWPAGRGRGPDPELGRR